MSSEHRDSRGVHQSLAGKGSSRIDSGDAKRREMTQVAGEYSQAVVRCGRCNKRIVRTWIMPSCERLSTKPAGQASDLQIDRIDALGIVSLQ